MEADREKIDEGEKREIMETAHALADAAAKESLKLFRSGGLQVDNKDGGGFDPVTEADRNSERAMRAILAERRPRDGILGEEFERSDSESGLTWVLDPIDGTRAFISGAPTWGTLVAVSDSGGPLFGIVDQPYIGERFAGGFGVAEASGQRGRFALRTRSVDSLSEAILYSTYPEIGSEEEREAFHRLAPKARLTRYGFDCYAYAMLAAGCIDLVVEAGMQPYDVHAPIAVVTAAGGMATDWQGNSAASGGRIIAAASAGIHEAALEILNSGV